MNHVPQKSVPREFLGQARAFLASVDKHQADAYIAIQQLQWRIYRRATRRQGFDAKFTAEMVKLWRDTVPTVGRLGNLKTSAGRNVIRISDCRMLVLKETRDGWAEGATAPALVLYIVDVDTAANPAFNGGYVAAVSMHALARRFQRGFDNTEPAILADLLQVARGSPVLRAQHRADPDDPRFTVPAAAGRWVGEMVYEDVDYVGAADIVPRPTGEETLMPVVSTFLPEGSDAR